MAWIAPCEMAELVSPRLPLGLSWPYVLASAQGPFLQQFQGSSAAHRGRLWILLFGGSRVLAPRQHLFAAVSGRGPGRAAGGRSEELEEHTVLPGVEVQHCWRPKAHSASQADPR